MTQETDSRDLILSPNEYAFIRDATKGEINVYIGPTKQSLAGTDKCVRFNEQTKKFVSTNNIQEAVTIFYTAPHGWYILLKNPAENDKHPTSAGKLTTPALQVGRKVNISGPASFALWPGQMAKVVKGHNLRSNEYLLVRVYDEEAAKLNLERMVIKTASGSEASAEVKLITQENLSMGKQFIIRGTDVSFYIPPTGIEVVPEIINGEERWVRQAVSLERLEYCLLLDQDGTKRYVHGPDVVFPKPTENFVEAPIRSNPDKAKAKKFRAQELTPNSGIHIRVIADYMDDETGVEHSAGDELFITGREQTIYFPREEHAIIKYGDQDIHYGIAIPSGEARYVLDRESGKITLVKGPQVFLPDPRKQVIAQRTLSLSMCSLLYPGNTEAHIINLQRAGVEEHDIMSAALALGDVTYNGNDTIYTQSAMGAVATPDSTRRVAIKGASKAMPGDSFDRKTKYTAPRSITLNTKYDGAVSVDVWSGYAMMLVKKTGERRVVVGPQTALLEYDEAPQVLTLSTGKPKNMDKPLQTVFLLTKANMVSDLITVETKDYIKLQLKVSYRVNFEGADETIWFSVDNYVKFLTDHMRSRIRSAVQKLGIEEFYSTHTDVVRATVLGTSTPTGRAGTLFSENNMRIYDVEVLEAQILNKEVEALLVQAQREVITDALKIESDKRKLALTAQSEELIQASEQMKAETYALKLALNQKNIELKFEHDKQALDAETGLEIEKLNKKLETQAIQLQLGENDLVRTTKIENAKLELKKKELVLEIERIVADTKAMQDKAGAISPDLIAALQAFGDKAMVEKVAETMAPLAILGGQSVGDVISRLLQGTTLEEVVNYTKLR